MHTHVSMGLATQSGRVPDAAYDVEKIPEDRGHFSAQVDAKAMFEYRLRVIIIDEMIIIE
jgi:hypothetical protein